MRIKSDKELHNGGYLHRLGHARRLPPPPSSRPVPSPTIDAAKLAAFYREDKTACARLSWKLGVAAWTLEALEVGWSIQHQAWTFPMRDGEGKIIGIRLRNEAGRKWAVAGSRNGLFIPAGDVAPHVCVCEGPTDCAALLTLGCYAIGRPSCSGAADMVVQFVKLHDVRRVTIIADNDAPGLDGAERLRKLLPVRSSIKKHAGGYKDIREYLRAGAPGCSDGRRRRIANEVQRGR